MLNNRQEKMSLGAFFHPTGNHVAAWLHPGSQIDAGTNFEHYVRIAQTAEAAKFDLMFLADAVATRNGRLDALRRWPQYMCFFEPITLLSGIAAVTRRLGLVATATTSYNEPFHIARKFASLDHISHGRAGWNMVTSSNTSESFNFGRDRHYDHDFKYDRATEFVNVVKGLWDSWDDDAFQRDRASGIYFDPEKLHHLNHRGNHFQVRGPLQQARPPQGYPVLAQAGNSTDFKNMAAQHAEIIFTSQNDLARAQVFYKELKAAVRQHGRTEQSQKIMPGLSPIVGQTEKEARERFEYLQSLIHPDVGREVLSNDFGNIDLSKIGVDQPFPEEMIAPAYTEKFRKTVAMTGEERPTLRQMYAAYGSARGQRPLIGSASQIADEMARWFNGYGGDGFLIHPAYLPEGLDDFCRLVIPELQTRGLFREDYEGETLRENMRLERPVSRYKLDEARSAS
jgi:N-acetyl-S-(2-succino)cysteine monooxygenase